MIPSDHFTRFYNEVFKFLEKQGEEDLQAYWLEISKNQEKHTLEPDSYTHLTLQTKRIV